MYNYVHSGMIIKHERNMEDVTNLNILLSSCMTLLIYGSILIKKHIGEINVNRIKHILVDEGHIMYMTVDKRSF